MYGVVSVSEYCCFLAAESLRQEPSAQPSARLRWLGHKHRLVVRIHAITAAPTLPPRTNPAKRCRSSSFPSTAQVRRNPLLTGVRSMRGHNAERKTARSPHRGARRGNAEYFGIAANARLMRAIAEAKRRFSGSTTTALTERRVHGLTCNRWAFASPPSRLFPLAAVPVYVVWDLAFCSPPSEPVRPGRALRACLLPIAEVPPLTPEFFLKRESAHLPSFIHHGDSDQRPWRNTR